MAAVLARGRCSGTWPVVGAGVPRGPVAAGAHGKAVNACTGYERKLTEPVTHKLLLNMKLVHRGSCSDFEVESWTLLSSL